MTDVHLFELVLLLLCLTIPLELLARRFGLPPAAALILGGMGLALIPVQHEIRVDPDLVLVLFLPPLLMAGAFFTVWRDFRANLRIILQLAVGAVVFTTAVVGVVAHWMVPGLPWAVCFALGAIVSPPDAVAAKAVLQQVRLPPKMVVLLEGESLVNDASGLVLFRFAVAAAMTGAFSARQAVASFALVAVGGILVGVAFGVAAAWVIKRLEHVHMGIVAGLLIAWASYIGADAIGVSGVLSTVACGLIIGWRQHTILSAVARTHARAVWEVVVFVLESLVFVLIGLALRPLLQRIGATPGWLGTVAPGVTAVVAAVILTRFGWIFPVVYVTRLLVPSMRGPGRATARALLIMSWAGMRGVVSLAAALSLPEAMPGRDFILLATFTTILVTVLGQGATLGPLIRWMKLGDAGPAASVTLGEPEARMRMAGAQLEAVRALAIDADGTVIHPRLLAQYEYRAEASRRYSESEGALEGARQDHFGVVLGGIAAGRAALLRLHRAGEIHDRVLLTLEQELDLEEMAALRHRGG